MTQPTHDILVEISRVLRLEGEAILACLARLEKPNPQQNAQKGIVQAVAALRTTLDRGGKIVVTGIGKSGKVGQKIAATLSSTGSLAVFLHPTEGLHGDLGILTPQDAVLALSYTGNTEELIRLLPSIKSLRVPLIGMGGNPDSQLGLQCDYWIDAQVTQEACPHNLAPTTSTTLTLALGDAIAVALMQLRGFDEKRFAQNHPGGSLGRRLQLQVRDLMHSGASVPVVAPDAPMDDVIIQATRGKLGAVLVTQGQTLLGIITDGDLRRALQHREKLFTLKASDVMTAKPITVDQDQQAIVALELMEKRKSQINVLPVVDSQGNWIGLLRLHDLVQAF